MMNGTTNAATGWKALAAILVLAVLFLGYEVLKLNGEVTRASNARPAAVVPNGFMLSGINSSGSSDDGFWLYKSDENQVYHFAFDPQTKEIEKTMIPVFAE